MNSYSTERYAEWKYLKHIGFNPGVKTAATEDGRASAFFCKDAWKVS